METKNPTGVGRRIEDRSAGDWIESFLVALKNSGNIRWSCEKAGITRSTAYDRKAKDKEFAERWAEAFEDGLDHIEGAAWTKAQQGDNACIFFLLKAHRRPIYGDKVEHSGNLVTPEPDIWKNATTEELQEMERIHEQIKRRVESGIGSSQVD